MIGGAERRVGKTLLACSLIGKFAASNPTAIKVTRGGESHHDQPPEDSEAGLLLRARGNYWIWEEKSISTGKDTSRFLAAGAAHAYWFCWRKRVEEGLGELLDIIGRDAPIVCESGGLRLAVEPGLFFLIQRLGSPTRKQSFLSLMQFADRLVNFNGEKFDLDLDDVIFLRGKWSLKPTSEPKGSAR